MTHEAVTDRGDEKRLAKTTVTLAFDPAVLAQRDEKAAKELLGSLSAAAFDDASGHLWVAGDEGRHVERLTRQADGAFAAHVAVDLGAAFGLDPEVEELDLEGLAIAGGFLWLAGSHAVKRKKPKAGKPGFGRDADGTPLVRDETELATERALFGALPLDVDVNAPAGGRRLRPLAAGNALRQALSAHPLIAPFALIPAKDNGLDVEGLSVVETAEGFTAIFGLRGPVVGGMALVVRVGVTLKPGRLALEDDLAVTPVDLGGFGIRDIARRGDDLLLLAGPAMAHDAPARLWLWRGAATNADAPPPVPAGLIGRYGDADNPEGLDWFEDGHVLVLTDSAAGRRVSGTRYTADLTRLDAQT